MAPDINSLPPSRSTATTISTTQPAQTSPLPHRYPAFPPSPHSPRTARRLNSFSAGDSTTSSRRGSSSRNSPSTTNFPVGSIPSLGAHGPPHHARNPSLGELHQELEEEQEAQVNRLLGMIRRQEAQIAEMTSAQRTSSQSRERGEAVTDAHSRPSLDQSRPSLDHPRSSLEASRPSLPHRTSSHSSSRQNVSAPVVGPRPGSSRRSSYRSNSRTGSPFPGAFAGFEMDSGRDEVALLQAESAMVMRENRMLKGRIRELERMVAEARGQGTRGAAVGGQSTAA